MPSWSAAWLVLCAGCMFQQTSTTEIRVKDPGLVVVRDDEGRLLLDAHADSTTVTPTGRVAVGSSTDKSTRADAPVKIARDDRRLVIEWPDRPQTLVARNGYVLAGHSLPMPDLDAGELTVPVETGSYYGPCNRARRNYRWSCNVAIWTGELASPWSNVVSVKRSVVPIDHAWASFDLVVGGLLSAIAVSFLLPPHERRGATSDTAIGVGVGVPGLLGLINGIGILARSPHEEAWTSRK